jgi:hypothetical protein
MVRVYAALGETATGSTTRHDLLAGDPFVFANAVSMTLAVSRRYPGTLPTKTPTNNGT